MTALVSIRGVSKRYTRGKQTVDVLQKLDLDIAQGDFLALMGPSGSGKTTLLNLIGGLDKPSGGEVRVDGKRIDTLSAGDLAKWRARHVGFVFQFYNLIPSLTVRENVALVAEIAERPMPPEAALAMVGMSHRLDHFPGQLSGGEQQRVAVARAIVKRPDALLCDEPTGALDVETGKLVLSAIARANAEMGATTIVITHNAAIAGMADRVLRMGAGRIVAIEANPHRLPPEALAW